MSNFCKVLCPPLDAAGASQAGNSHMFEHRPGERRLDFQPGSARSDATVMFIGTIHSPWKDRADCPKNMRLARERGEAASLTIDPAFRAGLMGLMPEMGLILLSWLHHAPRDLIVQRPRHSERPSGTFALRSPARPNPVGLHVVQLMSIDADAGKLVVDAIDVLDGTPLIDMKPWLATTDVAGAQ